MNEEINSDGVRLEWGRIEASQPPCFLKPLTSSPMPSNRLSTWPGALSTLVLLMLTFGAPAWAQVTVNAEAKPTTRARLITKQPGPQVQAISDQSQQAAPEEVTPAPEPQSPAPLSFRWPHEELYYSIRLNGAEALRAGVRTGAPRMHNNEVYVPISATARSTGFFHSIYPLDDRINAFLNPRDMRPYRSDKIFDEKGQIRGYDVTYRHSEYEARVTRRHNDRTTNFSAPIPAMTHNMLTWLYALRAEERLAIGNRYSYYIYDGWLLSRLDLHVVAAEDVYTPMGWFKAWKVDFSREIMGTRPGPIRNNKRTEPVVGVREAARHTGSFWVSRDENHIPIKLSIQSILGVGEAVLIRYKPANQN